MSARDVLSVKAGVERVHRQSALAKEKTASPTPRHILNSLLSPILADAQPIDRS